MNSNVNMRFKRLYVQGFFLFSSYLLVFGVYMDHQHGYACHYHDACDV